MRVVHGRIAMLPGLTHSFLGVEGTAPYNYVVDANGAGGSITADGIYTAPVQLPELRTDIIRVTDAEGLEATATVVVGTRLELLCDILQQELGLADGKVYIWDQKINSPLDRIGMWVTIAEVASKAFGNSVNFDSTSNEEVRSVNMRSIIDVNLNSRDTSARDRKEEVLMALTSQYSKLIQSKNSFRIFHIPSSISNLSQEDGAAIPYRFVFSIAMQYFISKRKAVPYFDTFEEPTVNTEA